MKKLQLVCLVMMAIQLVAFGQEASQRARLNPVYVDGRWGYADERGRIVIAARFDAAREFAGGLAQVGMLDEELPEVAGQPNLKWGYIDERGRVVVELRYAVLHAFAEDRAAVAVLDAEKPERSGFGRNLDRRNLKWGFVDRSGRLVIPLEFLDAGDFSEGLAAVNVGKANTSMCGKPLNYGYIDKTGAFVIKPQFAGAASFRNGRARVSVGEIRYLGRCVCCGPRFHGKRGQVDRSGTFIADEGQGDDATSGLEVPEY